MHQPPFGIFDDLFEADPYEIAASALVLFGKPKIQQHELQVWLRGLVGQKSETFLGLNLSEPPPLEAVEHKVVLIWEHALVVSRTLEGSDRAYASLLLLDPRCQRSPYPERLRILRSAAGL